MTKPLFTIRPACIDDVPTIFSLIKELAEYEKALEQVVTTEQDLKATLFDQQSTSRALMVEEVIEENSVVIGYAVYFTNYSTWLGKHGLYLEDLYIQPQARHRGAGTAVLKHLARYCIEQGYGRFEWSVLDWNTPSIQFYESLGAKAQDEWITYRLSGEALEKLAQS